MVINMTLIGAIHISTIHEIKCALCKGSINGNKYLPLPIQLQISGNSKKLSLFNEESFLTNNAAHYIMFYKPLAKLISSADFREYFLFEPAVIDKGRR